MLHTKTFAIAAAAALLAAGFATGLPAGAQAQEVRIKQAGDIVLGFGMIGVLPEKGGHTSIGGTPNATNTMTPQLDISYFFTPNIALNLIAATTRHGVTVGDSAIGDAKLGRVWVLPPTLTLQYHPLPASRLSPYVGAGINYTVFYNEGGNRSSAVTDVDVKNTWGWALNAGVDYALDTHWGLNFDVKKLFLKPDVSVNHGAIMGKADLDPWIVGASVRYRF